MFTSTRTAGGTFTALREVMVRVAATVPFMF